MAADCSFFLLSAAFTTVCAPYCLADASALLLLPLVNCFSDGSHAVLLRGWERILIPLLINRFHDGFRAVLLSGWQRILIPPLINSFHDGFRTVLLSAWQRIAHSSARQQLSRRFARRVAQRMVSDCSIFRSPTAFTTIRMPHIARRIAHSSARLRQLTPSGSHTIFLSGWQRITHSSARQRLSRLFARRIAQGIVADCSFFLSSTAFTTICAPYSSVDGSGLLIPPLINGFHDGLSAVLLCGWQRIAQSYARQRRSRRFARRIA